MKTLRYQIEVTDIMVARISDSEKQLYLGGNPNDAMLRFGYLHVDTTETVDFHEGVAAGLVLALQLLENNGIDLHQLPKAVGEIIAIQHCALRETVKQARDDYGY